MRCGELSPAGLPQRPVGELCVKSVSAVPAVCFAAFGKRTICMKRKMRKIVAAALCVLLIAACFSWLTACKKKEVVESYSYNFSMSVFPTDWNPHTLKTDADAVIAEYTTCGLYAFDFNETRDGYLLVPEAAAGEPTDVTSRYVGEEWGISAVETGRAWEIPLRKDLRWENGEPITAQSYVNSLRLLLDPRAQNYRAGTVCGDTLTVANAENYLRSGKHAYADALIGSDFSGYIPMDEFVYDAETGIATVDGKDFAVVPDAFTTWDPGNTLEDHYETDGICFYDVIGIVGEGDDASLAPAEGAVDMFAEMKKAENADGAVVLTQKFIGYLQLIVARLHGYATVESYAGYAGDYAYTEWQELVFVGKDYAPTEFSSVGIKALDNGDLLLILEKPTDAFHLKYDLTSTWLVNETLYEKCTGYADGKYGNTYGTGVAEYMSFGPYKLTAFEADGNIRLERNTEWYGYADKANEGLYQTTAINISYIVGEDARRDAFYSGRTDEYLPSGDEISALADSPQAYRDSGDSVYFIAFNPDADAYVSSADGKENDGKAILTVPQFRKAISLAIDRTAFALAAAPVADAAYSVFPDNMMADPEDGVPYGSSEQAARVLVDFWGLSDQIGEGGKYATVQEAAAHITGYDPDAARELFCEAYTIAVESGLMDADDGVEITVGIPDPTSAFYTVGYSFVVLACTEAVKGTPLEGKLTFRSDDTLGNAYGDALRSNRVDMLFGVGWSGGALDPQALLSAYTEPAMQYDDAWDTSAEIVAVTFSGLTDRSDLNGVTVEMSLYDWATKALAGEDAVGIADGGETVTVNAGIFAESTLRLCILAACESALLERCDLIPLVNDNSVTVRSYKINYGSGTYVYGIGRGGVKYMTYNYSDAEWEEFVRSRGGTLSYE